ncbi:uncharacterized protein LOC131162138 [Malania oleifera]|uniref:uncharacterized protein LOC131162138 n=1 Tax=Malania oleifera TaxID=397392 RepID=UPI0025AE7652|nr:uncharacterized protein LOC131162138 [Malania oleifera]
MEKLWGLNHLFMTVFLHNFSTFMVIPAITDVTMSALCPGKDECSLAIYLTGFQQAVIGLGTLVMMPLVGNLSDVYGRKALLMLPLTLTIFPLGILAYSRTTNFFYAYYVFRTITAMVCEGSVHCLALAYVADNIPETRRASAFGILSGIGSSAFVCGTLSTRFLSTSSTFQVAASVASIAVVYMRVFLPESIANDDVSSSRPLLKQKHDSDCSDGDSSRNPQLFRTMPSLDDTISLLKSSVTFSQAAIVAFFNNLGDVGLHTSLLYYLKARFHFNKDQFADLMVISGIAGTISQLLLMPMLVPVLGEEKLLSIGVLFSFAHMFLYSIAWSFWVPYAAAMFSILMVFSHPCIRSIVSKQVGPSEQGKAQGCISGICSFANVISPLAFSPLTALFLSERAPFHFPGFSIMCAGFASMIAFLQTIRIRAVPPIPIHKASNCNGMEA